MDRGGDDGPLARERPMPLRVASIEGLGGTRGLGNEHNVT